MNGKKSKWRAMTFTRGVVLQRIDKILLTGEDCGIVSNSQILLLKRVPLSVIKDFSDNVGAFMALDYVFFIVRKGFVSVMVDSVERTVVQGCVGFASVGSVACITDFSDDVDLACVVVDTDEMWLALRESMPMWMLAIANSMCITVNKKVCTILDGILDVVYNVLSAGVNETSCHILRGLVFTFVHVVDSSCPGIEENMHWGTKRQTSVVAQFMQLIKYSCLTQHGLDFYARKLCVSPQHLCNLVKDALGVSAKMCIDKTITLHMKKMMICDNLSAEEVSNKMNFSTTSIANRFFKRVEGITLKDYEKLIVRTSV